MKEATARIKINRLLEAAGLRFFDDAHGAANIRLESVAETAGDHGLPSGKKSSPRVSVEA